MLQVKPANVEVYRSRGLNTWLAACWSVFLLVGLSMLLVAESTGVERVMGGGITVGSVFMIWSALRREVHVGTEGFVIRQFRTRHVPWASLRSVRVGPSGIGYGIRIRVEGDRFPRLLPVGAFGRGARQQGSVVMRLAAALSDHLPHTDS